MDTNGRVVQSDAAHRWVEIAVERGNCTQCGNSRVCIDGQADVQRRLVCSDAAKHLLPGQEVVVSVPDAAVLRAALLVYGLPLLGAVFGALLGERLGQGVSAISHLSANTLAALAPLGALVGVGCGFALVRRIGKFAAFKNLVSIAPLTSAGVPPGGQP